MGAEASVLDAGVRARLVPLAVKRVVPETADAVSLVLDVPPGHADLFAYRAGQFVTVRVTLDGAEHLRSYSMSSAPELDRDLRITVKRVPGGVVSNWLNDHVRDGDLLEVTPPAGRFVIEDGTREVVAVAAGSGITPVFSIVRSLVATATGSAALLYANRDAASVIFGAELDRLAAQHRDRFRLAQHLDVEDGLVTAATIANFLGAAAVPEVYVCGPGGFIDVVESALLGMGIDRQRIHVERFSPDEPLVIAEAVPSEITIRTAGRKLAVGHRPGTTLLQTARSAGLRPPSSCETGTCATCMARVVDGEVRMRRNEALSPDEVAGGWVLTCQAEPVTASVTVVYE